MKFPQKFRAGDYLQWRLNSTTDNFNEPISSPDWSVTYYFRTNTDFLGATATSTAHLDGFQFTLASNVTETFTAGDVSQYLANYPDIAQEYNATKDKLIEDSGNDIFNSLEGYAKWHYDNYGKDEGRIFDRPLPNMVAAQGALTTNIDTSMDGFTGDQVRGAMMGVES